MKDPVTWVIAGVLALLVYKYAWSLWAFDFPMGYDVGFYRYLFIRHAEGFPPFWITDLEPWARAHPLGLFFFSTIFLRLGIPVDWLIGWMWNLLAVVLLCVLSWTAGKKYGRDIGIWTLVACVLSVATFDGFAAMYFKTFASLLWMILTFRAIEKQSWLAVPFGILTVITHNQTGLLFGLVLISYYLLPFIPLVFSTKTLTFRSIRLRDVLLVAGAGILVIAIGLLAYLPVWKDAVLSQLPALLGQTEASSGSFPPALFYLETEAIVLFFAAYGFVLQLHRERWSLWQLSCLWSLLFVVAHLLFYRRFFLQLEFFLLPFAGIGLNYAWNRWRAIRFRAALVTLLVVQLLVMKQAITRNGPMADDTTFNAVLQIGSHVPDTAFLLSLENETPVLLRGWYPSHKVGGPGLFDAPWSLGDWQRFLIDGTHDDKVSLLQRLPQPVYLFVSPYFLTYYRQGNYAQTFLHDSCFEPVPGTMLFRVICL